MIFFSGDFNSRTQSLPDFIENDLLHNGGLDSLKHTQLIANYLYE